MHIRQNDKMSLTKAEFLSLTPPLVSYSNINAAPRRNSTVPILQIKAQAPQHIDKWVNFIDEVNSYQMNIDNTQKQLRRPVFLDDDEEENQVHSKQDLVTLSRNVLFEPLLRNFLRDSNHGARYIQEVEVARGGADIYYFEDIPDNKPTLYCAIEIKPKWTIHLEDPAIHLADLYQKEEEEKENVKVKDKGSGKKKSSRAKTNNGISDVMKATKNKIGEIVRQLFGYMCIDELQYGILTTYDQTWFFKRPKETPGHLLISDCIRTDHKSPTLLQSIHYFLDQLATTDPFSSLYEADTTPSIYYDAAAEDSDDSMMSLDVQIENTPLHSKRRADDSESETSNHNATSPSKRRRKKTIGETNKNGEDVEMKDDINGIKVTNGGIIRRSSSNGSIRQLRWSDFRVGELLGTCPVGKIFAAEYNDQPITLKIVDASKSRNLVDGLEHEHEIVTHLKELQGTSFPYILSTCQISL